MNLVRTDNNKVILFSQAELQCPKTGVVRLADGFAAYLVELREAFGEPMIPTSCCRSEEHNHAIDGHPRSLHVYDRNWHGLNGTAAIDIGWPHPAYRRHLLSLALDFGWSVGVAKNFIHLDRRDLAGLAPTAFGY